MRDVVEHARELIRIAEAQVHARMMSEAVTQSFSGNLRVNPNKVPVTTAAGRRAVENLRKYVKARQALQIEETEVTIEED